MRIFISNVSLTYHISPIHPHRYLGELRGDKTNKKSGVDSTTLSGHQGSEGTENTKETRLQKQFWGVIAACSAKVPFHAFEQSDMKKFHFLLDHTFKFPHRRRALSIQRVVWDTLIDEIRLIIVERQSFLEHSFVGLQTNFWTDPARKDSFGAIIASVIADNYGFKNGDMQFMSQKTLRSLTPSQSDEMIDNRANLDKMNVAITFKSFGTGSKKAIALGKWTDESCKVANIEPNSVGVQSADGAGLAGCSSYKWNIRRNRLSENKIVWCHAHKNNLSIRDACGVGACVVNKNEYLRGP